jgi:hypothetical protein
MEIGYLEGIATDSNGNVYFAGSSNAAVRQVDSSSGIITTFAGTGTHGYTRR